MEKGLNEMNLEMNKRKILRLRLEFFNSESNQKETFAKAQILAQQVPRPKPKALKQFDHNR